MRARRRRAPRSPRSPSPQPSLRPSTPSRRHPSGSLTPPRTRPLEEVIPDESLDVAEAATVEEETPPEDVWADPTPTAIGDTVGLDEDTAEAPEEDTASFSSLIDDEPFATAGTATAEADDPRGERGRPPATPEADAAGRDHGIRCGSSARRGAVRPRRPVVVQTAVADLLVYNEQSGEWVPSPTPLPELEQPEPSRFRQLEPRRRRSAT